MAIILMLGWWYGRGWIWVIDNVSDRLKLIGQIFAVKILLKTWFSPWKQIYSPSTFRNFLRNMVDNAVSRCVGAIVRGMMLFCALVLGVGTIGLGLVGLIIWPFLPFLIIILPILALAGVTF